jgi:hypothetical protein
VSMASDELLARTQRSRRSGAQTSQEYLNAFRSPLRSLDRTLLGDPGLHSDSEIESSASAAARGGAANYPASVSDSSTFEFRITTSFEEKSEDGDDNGDDNDDDFPSVTEIERIDPEQFEEDMLCPEDDESESDDDPNDANIFNRNHSQRRRQIGTARQQNNPNAHDLLRRRRTSSLMAPVPSATRDNSSFTNRPFQSSDVLKPHARFCIEGDKSMVSIKFDPPPYAKPAFHSFQLLILA